MWGWLRKFGLQYCDLPTMIWNVSTTLKILTLNIDPSNTEGIPIAFYVIIVVIATCYFYVYMVSMAWFVFCRCWETGDLIAAMIVFSLGTSSEIGTAKLLFMLLNRNKVRKIVGKYLESDSWVEPESRFAKNMIMILKQVKKRALIFWIVIIGNGVVYISKPLLTPGRHLLEDNFILYGLEPPMESPNYEITYFLMTFGSIFTVYVPANITAFHIIITGYSEAQILALSKEILNIWDDAVDHFHRLNVIDDDLTEPYKYQNEELDYTFQNKTVNDNIKESLGKIVKIHTTNLNLLNEVEGVFRGAIAVEFLLLGIGLIAELLGGLEYTYLEVPFALMQVAMDCLTGQRLIDASMVLEQAVYASKWENFNVENRKMVLVILLNSQKTMKLTAGGITVLNFISLMTIFKSIYSVYTTLRTTIG